MAGKFVDFVMKDTSGTNESKRLLLTVRLLCLSVFLYTLIMSVYCTVKDFSSGFVFLGIFAVVFVLVTIMTYFFKTFTCVCLLNLGLLVWIYLNLFYFGWNIGVQHFILVMLVLEFFVGYKNYVIKGIYAVVLAGVRIALFFLFGRTEGVVDSSLINQDLMQIINTIFVFWCISLIAYLFSRDSHSVEGKLVEYNIQLKTQAETDPLTGLNNRRSATDYLQQCISTEPHEPMSVCIGDIDFFKKVNDNYGHDVGDIVLKQVSATMQKVLDKHNSFISRWGGEEFLIIINGVNGDDAYVIMEELRAEIKKIIFTIQDRTFSITMTYGLSEYDFGNSIDDNIKEADAKLYLGKEHGRDQIVY